ncbi:hypothetical protein B0H19DRAFT_1243101 [Mycena capillaripes]|nr:hypothetical protein B0H19DRAFT_1243101 [Mycena capillaripes]
MSDIEIVGDRRMNYEIRRAGLDPGTGEPWATSWMAKSRVPKHLADAWKENLKGVRDRWEKENQGRGQSKAPSHSSPEPLNAEERGQETLPITHKRKRVESLGDDAPLKSKQYAKIQTAAAAVSATRISPKMQATQLPTEECGEGLDPIQSSPCQLGSLLSPIPAPLSENYECPLSPCPRTPSPLQQSLFPTPAKLTNLWSEAMLLTPPAELMTSPIGFHRRSTSLTPSSPHIMGSDAGFGMFSAPDSPLNHDKATTPGTTSDFLEGTALCLECDPRQLLTLEHVYEANHKLSFSQEYDEDKRHSYKAKIFRCFPDLKFHCICGEKFATVADGKTHISSLNGRGPVHIKTWGKAKMKGTNVPRKKV